MPAEKFTLIPELQKRAKLLEGEKKLALVGQGDFPAANNVMRATMNIKHQIQHVAVDNSEFPMIYDGKEEVVGEHSSFYHRTKGASCVVTNIVKKYDGRLKGKSKIALYFLYYKDLDAYHVVERKEVEDLTEDFGFTYDNDYLDACEVGDTIPAGTRIHSSRSYDKNGNVGIGVNGRILFGMHPMVEEDAIGISESFAKRMVTTHVVSKTIPIGEHTILLNLYGKDGEYQGLPNIGDVIHNGILCATRNVKEHRMFSDLRDSSLSTLNLQSDQVFYGNGEVVDINIYCNNPNLAMNKVNRQILEYYNDARWFYTEVYKVTKAIIAKGAKYVSPEINRWKRRAMNYLDTQAIWAFNDNVFNNLMIEILIMHKDPIKVGRKVTGRHGNKTVVSTIIPDDEMPYLTTDFYVDEYGVTHPKGERIPVELITNPLAIINRTIPMALFEPSVTFILDRMRQHMKTLETLQEQHDYMFDIIGTLNEKFARELEDVYKDLSDREKRKFIEKAIYEGTSIRWEAFDDNFCLRDNIIKIYEKFSDTITPYHIFMPKPKWGRDIYIGDDCIGFQYMLMLKQSGEKGFSIRSSGAISDESLPEKSHESKIGKQWASDTAVRFGFMVITNPEDFALVTALYRSSIDGRRFMYEAILSEDGDYNLPEKFTSRTAEILQVYLKSLGVRMETIINEDEYIGEAEFDDTIVGFTMRNRVIFCTPNEMYYLKKLKKIYKRYQKESLDDIVDLSDAWDYILEHLPFKKKHLTDNIINLFKNNIEAFS